ncbi:hypothetical protein A2U01_0117315, partial [Trifolium medium]|nr:hypothetical protein [Trifolium medium]
ISKTRARVVFEAYVLSGSDKVLESSRGCVCYVCVVEDGREDRGWCVTGGA